LEGRGSFEGGTTSSTCSQFFQGGQVEKGDTGGASVISIESGKTPRGSVLDLNQTQRLKIIGKSINLIPLGRALAAAESRKKGEKAKES